MGALGLSNPLYVRRVRMTMDIPENSFEVLVMNEGLSIRRFPNGIYQVRQVNHRWRYWQAREEIADTEKKVLLSRIESLKTEIQSLKDALAGKRAQKRISDNKPPIPKKIDFTVLTPQYLREHLSYDPESGVMSWLKPCSSKSRAVIGRQAGGITSTGYWQIKLGANRYLVSRLAFLYMTGEWPANVVDHIDRNRENNRWSNLRDVSQSENNRNKATPTRKSMSSPIPRGVYQSGRKWVVIVRIKGRPTYLGQFASKDEAAEVAAPYFADVRP